MTANTGPLLLDVTRLVSRVGRRPLSGIDRIELEYLRRAQVPGQEMRLWVGTEERGKSGGGMLLDAEAAAMLERLLLSPAQPPRGWWEAGPKGRAQWSLWQKSAAQAGPAGVERLLANAFPGGGRYLNVGHANVSDDSLLRIGAAGLGITVMIHDTIPLDHPEFSRPVTRGPAIGEIFATKLSAVSRHARHILCPTQVVADDVSRHLAAGPLPPVSVAPLGIVASQPDMAAASALLPSARPWFVTIGTIEPRKNHSFLLDLWEEMAREDSAETIPLLIVIGRRGWAAPELLARIDRLPPSGPVRVFHNVDDAAAMGLLAGSRGLLFPSLAEGCGLPALEAAALGVPVICSDLPVFRETLGNYPVYATPGDSYSWLEAIEQLAWAPVGEATRKNPPPLPSWDEHFGRVLGDPAKC
ncbi:MAG: glycosyltransferase family 4 protein [Paracoccaceae bacterium]